MHNPLYPKCGKHLANMQSDMDALSTPENIPRRAQLELHNVNFDDPQDMAEVRNVSRQIAGLLSKLGIYDTDVKILMSAPVQKLEFTLTASTH